MQRFVTRSLVLTSIAGALATCTAAVADFSIDVFSPTVTIATAAHAPDDLLTSSPILGGPFPAEDIGGTGPLVDVPAAALGFGGFEIDAISWDLWSFVVQPGQVFTLYFTVDRLAVGQPGSAVFREAAIGEAAGDVFEPVTYPWFLAPPPFPQPMPANPPSRPPFGPGKNMWAPRMLNCPIAPIVPEAGGDHRNLSLVQTPPGPLPPIDEMDALDCFTASGLLYSSLTPATGMPMPGGIVGADILVSTGGIFFPYALAITMGLDGFGAGTDDIDGLLVVDVDGVGTQSAAGIDFALFSLRAGSQTLLATGRSPGDIFITDYTGGFDIFAYAGELGLRPNDELDGFTLGFATPPAKCADQDGDGDVDLAEFSLFVQCFGGPNVPPASTCAPGVNCDYDNDGDVDATDFAVFLQCFGGSGNPVPASCPLGC